MYFKIVVRMEIPSSKIAIPKILGSHLFFFLLFFKVFSLLCPLFLCLLYEIL